MPPITNTQNALGIGGPGATTTQKTFSGLGTAAPYSGLVGGLSGGAGGGGQNPYDLGAAFRDYYGGIPTHQIVGAMANGQSPTQGAPGGTLSNGVGRSVGSPAGPTATPAQAGQMKDRKSVV